MKLQVHTMRLLCIAVLLSNFLINSTAQAQSEKYLQVTHWMDSNHIPLNQPAPPAGFQQFRDCDSNVVYKKSSGDTITFFTVTSYGPMSFDALTEVYQRPYFNVIVYPRKVQEDGSVVMVRLAPKTFLLRHDSLYLLDYTEKRAYSMIKWFREFESLNKEIMDSLSKDPFVFAQSTPFQRQDTMDMENLKEETQLLSGEHPPYFKLIFHKGLFQQSGSQVFKRKPIVIEERDTIPEEEVEWIKQWEQGGKQCYMVRVNANYYMDSQNDYGEFLFSSDGTFLEWENCQANKKTILASIQLIKDSIAQRKSDSIYSSYLWNKQAAAPHKKKGTKLDSTHAVAIVKVYKKLGVIDKQGNELIPVKYPYISGYHEGLSVVAFNNKGGYIDEYGKEAIPFRYNVAADFSEGLAAVAIDKHYGFIDHTGKLVIPLKYEVAGPFTDGLALVQLHGKYGFINKEGKEVVPIKYDRVFNSFVDGFIVVQLNSKYDLVDKNGKELTSFKYDGLDNFSEGFAIVQVNNKEGRKVGFIDRTGKLVIPVKYDIANRFYNGLAIVGQNNWYGIIDSTGKEILSLKYDAISNFQDSLFSIRLNDGYEIIDRNNKEVLSLAYNTVYEYKYGYAIVEKDILGMGYKRGLIDSTGKEIIPPKYNDIDGVFNEGLTLVTQNGKAGFFNNKGEMVIPFKYDKAWPFIGGFAAVQSGKKWGFINKEGKEIVTCKYDEIKPFHEGFAGVSINKKWGFINNKGEEVIAIKYDGADDFSNGIVAVAQNDRWGYIDERGQQVIPFLFDHAFPFTKEFLQNKRHTIYF